MKNRFFALGTTALGLALSTWMAPAVGAQPLHDTIKVNMPYQVTLGNKTLEAGDYTIKEMNSPTKNYVLLFYKDNGMKFVTSSMTIPALANRTPEDSKIVLHRIGDDYYYDKIWVQGKDYGYEFPLPSKARQREKELLSASVTVPVTTGTATTTTTNTTATETTAAVTESTVPVEPATPVTVPEPTTAVDDTKPVDDDSSAANADMKPSDTPVIDEPTADQDQAKDGSAPAEAPKSMPATSAGWLMMLLGGGALSGAGAMLRRKR